MNSQIIYEQLTQELIWQRLLITELAIGDLKYSKNTEMVLKLTFDNLDSHSVIKKSFSKNLADAYVTKYRYHFIFYTQYEN